MRHIAAVLVYCPDDGNDVTGQLQSLHILMSRQRQSLALWYDFHYCRSLGWSVGEGGSIKS